MNILFVCTGNTCRSPMAEGYLKLKRPDISVKSAGIYADCSPVSKNSEKVCKKYSIDISRHISTPLTKELLDDADFIICMSKSHKAVLDTLTDKTKVLILGDSISDPFGMGIDQYENCFLKIKAAIDDFCERYL